MFRGYFSSRFAELFAFERLERIVNLVTRYEPLRYNVLIARTVTTGSSSTANNNRRQESNPVGSGNCRCSDTCVTFHRRVSSSHASLVTRVDDDDVTALAKTQQHVRNVILAIATRNLAERHTAHCVSSLFHRRTINAIINQVSLPPAGVPPSFHRGIKLARAS